MRTGPGSYSAPIEVAELADVDIFGPALSDDSTQMVYGVESGAELYLATYTEPTGFVVVGPVSAVDDTDILTATRPAAGQPFATPGPVSIDTPTNEDGDPDLSQDGLTLLFSSDRPLGLGGADIWMVTRTRQ